MNRTIDAVVLSIPLLVVIALIYFLLLWKPRQVDHERVKRAEWWFWSVSAILTIVVVLYVKFWRG